MKILIDGDACPVVNLTEKIAKKNGINLVVFTDITHQIQLNYGKVYTVDKANQSVDMALYNKCQKNDIVITQDYGLAAMVLGKGALAINSSGQEYTDENINHLLMKRHLHAKMRRAGHKHPTHSKRSKKDDQKFIKMLEKTIKSRLTN